jgi:uncharacterized protein YqgV (UPF0045/DUF77 family)
MIASVDISMYPLDKEYKIFILAYIKELNKYDEIKVISNTMSTQVFGEYDRLMEILSIENKRAMLKDPAMVIISKLVNADLKP